ncbi:peptidoglycan-binding protein LysM [Acinetobacter apis]|uniref:Potassium binding protein Kbp n=1 Tax=Acinetobacter apis TaxID=1229165 RepID=A0A217ECN8_9GAMM|nr:peptidoglycan-binding protein LysM [Acinetobacter apis]SNQ28243.1 BON domain-containing protein [Acinetobacter apis]
MGIFDFVKGIGNKITGKTEQQPTEQNAPASTPAAPQEPSAQEIANQLLSHIQSLGLLVNNLSVSYNSTTDTAILKGEVKSQADKEKVVLAVGNLEHVAQVDDQLTVAESAEPTEESQFYTVKSGDTLSKISKEFYGDANQYNKIFDANKPLLTDVNAIFPGQVLRIPK